MPLDKYKQKRNFKQSPEPPGDPTIAAARARGANKGIERFFCVQKHLASHLHYDLRLEHDGVLLSWAVPKGPSLDPATKRLAMMVEDHPIEYGEFEGVIPQGYGAGIVMLWDRGTWTPEGDDVGAALRKGDLKFTLNGYKLKGSWVLVRTKGKWAGSGDRSWLLIKHRDNWSGTLDIAEFAPLSVKSEHDFVDILAQDDPAIWTSNRPAQAGETGALFKRIVTQARAMKRGRTSEPAHVAKKALTPTRTKTATGTARARGTARATRAKQSGKPATTRKSRSS